MILSSTISPSARLPGATAKPHFPDKGVQARTQGIVRATLWQSVPAHLHVDAAPLDPPSKGCDTLTLVPASPVLEAVAHLQDNLLEHRHLVLCQRGQGQDIDIQVIRLMQPSVFVTIVEDDLP
jgi:hypothetical protein